MQEDILPALTPLVNREFKICRNCDYTTRVLSPRGRERGGARLGRASVRSGRRAFSAAVSSRSRLVKQSRPLSAPGRAAPVTFCLCSSGVLRMRFLGDGVLGKRRLPTSPRQLLSPACDRLYGAVGVSRKRLLMCDALSVWLHPAVREVVDRLAAYAYAHVPAAPKSPPALGAGGLCILAESRGFEPRIPLRGILA